MDDKCETCCARHKHREDAQYRSLITRLNRIEGQVRGGATWWRISRKEIWK
ncbi:MAG: hypothetical protein PUD04_02935 [Firmicutes bacterium]|nr:hypothetical protein [Lachnospiraceae bacterium]MDD6065516.1 hypothetical protein [Bacillota bacterium]MDY2819207.1 hypothetical protein [Hominisplanchenecus sp.]